MKNKIKICFKNLLRIITNQYVILVVVSLLALFAINVITGFVLMCILLGYLWIMFTLIKTAEYRKTYRMCFLISLIVMSIFAGCFICKIPALKYNFGAPKSIDNAKDIDICLKNGIKAVTFEAENVEQTQFVQKEHISFTGNRMTGDSNGVVKFYYSILTFDDVNVLVKHTESYVISNRTIIGYLSKLNSLDKQVYNNYAQDKLVEAVIAVDSEILDSNMLLWRMLTIFQFLTSLLSLIICIYCAINYCKYRELLKTEVPVNNMIHQRRKFKEIWKEYVLHNIYAPWNVHKNNRKQKDSMKLKRRLDKRYKTLYEIIERNNKLMSIIVKEKDINFIPKDFKILQQNITNIENNTYIEKYIHIHRKFEQNEFITKKEYDKLKKEVCDFSKEMTLIVKTLKKYI